MVKTNDTTFQSDAYRTNRNTIIFYCIHNKKKYFFIEASGIIKERIHIKF